MGQNDPSEIKIRILMTFTLPPHESPEGFSEIFQFAHEFDSDLIKNWDGSKVLGKQVHADWISDGTFPNNLDLIRAVLLIQVRIGKFVEGFPSDEEMPYLLALTSKIKELMALSEERQ